MVALVAAVAIIAIIRFEMLCLTDLSRARDGQLRYLTRQAWTVVIVVVIPIGGIAYLYLGRDQPSRPRS